MPERLTLADIYMVLANALVDLPPANLPQADSVPLELWAVQVSRVVIDSRQAMPDSVFVALRGEQTDGHQYVCDALKRGARCAIVDKEPRDWLSALDGLGTDVAVADTRTREALAAPIQSPTPSGGRAGHGERLHTSVVLVVNDTLEALQRLAAWWRTRFFVRVIGITGSIGKTTTKEYVASVLSQRYRVLKSQGNYNNEIGLPLTLLDLEEGHERVVLEMGTYGPGEIALLAQIARPQVGIVTNVGPVHLERMGTIERIAQAKSELPRSLPADGVAILNADDERVRAMSNVTPARVFLYGLAPSGAEGSEQELACDLWADEIESHGLDGVRFRFHYKPRTDAVSIGPTGRRSREEIVHAHIPMLGRHSVHTALRAAAAGLVEGLSWDEILSGLRTGEQLRLLAIPGIKGSTLLDDTYNSSPDSAIAALNLLDELDGRKIAVLGDMLELGAYAVKGHQRVARRAMDVVSILITVGDLGRLIGQEAVAFGMPSERVMHALDNKAAIDLLRGLVQEEDIVLIKGSRGIEMEEIVDALARRVDVPPTAGGGSGPALVGSAAGQSPAHGDEAGR